MTDTNINIHERDDDPLDVKVIVRDRGDGSSPYVELHIGPACFFVRDPMTLMKLTAMSSSAFNDLSAACREAS